MCNYSKLSFFVVFLLTACNSQQSTEENNIRSEKISHSSSEPAKNENSFEVKTFEVKDSSGKISGWGYDIYVDNSKMIHQPAIPAISGIHTFKTQDDALKTGTFAAAKMKSSGSLPTLTISELDSLGILPKP